VAICFLHSYANPPHEIVAAEALPRLCPHLFITTSHPQLSDPALLRPGRCDDHELIEDACPDQAARLFKRFFPDDGGLQAPYVFADNLKNRPPVSMAALQGHLTKYSHDWAAALQHAQEIFTRSFNEPQATEAAQE
jgi:hypothetical protein